MPMILDTAKFVAKNLLQVFFFKVSGYLNPHTIQTKKQMRKCNPPSLTGVCWDKGYSLNGVNKTFYVTHHFEICFTDFQIDILQRYHTKSFPAGIPQTLWSTDQVCSPTVLVFYHDYYYSKC